MKHGLGDCVCMIPTIRALRNTYPDWYIAVLVNGKANEEIFTHSGVKIDRFYYFSLKERPVYYTFHTLYQLRKEHFDYGVLAPMTPLKKGKIFFQILGVHYALGEQYRGIQFLDLDEKVHFIDRDLMCISPLCPRIYDHQPRLFARESELAYIESFFNFSHRRIALQIGGADKNYYKGNYVFTRNWKRSYMFQLAEKLSQLKGYDICLMGGKLEEKLIGDYRYIISKDNVINFVGRTNIGQSIALLSTCILSIGVDTGMQHAADALGIPTLSVFGPTNPHTHGAYSLKAHFIETKQPCQYCFGTDLYYTCANRKCMNDISPDQVFEKIEQILLKK